MNGIKFAFRQWRYQLKQMNFWIVMIVLLLFFWSYLAAGREVLSAKGERVGVFALFPIMASESNIVLVMFACLLVLISDIPTVYAGIEYQLIRMDRMKWYVGQITYIFLLNITFWILVIGMQLFCYIPYLSCRIELGDGITSGDAFASFGVMVPECLTDTNIMCKFAEAVGLCVMLGLLMGVICLVCNILGFHAGTGITICASLIVVWQFTICNAVDWKYFSPVGVLQSYSGYSAVPVVGAYAYYIQLCCILMFLGMYKVNRYDLNIGTDVS